MFKGVIIEESLENKDVLKKVKIVRTDVEKVTPDDQTPHLTIWTLHTVEIADEQAEEVADELSRSLDTKNGHWYADFKDNCIHYIIFPGKVFKVERDKPEQYVDVVSYGLEQGIPKHQLDFTPSIN